MLNFAGDPEIYPDLSGEHEATEELSGVSLTLLREIEVEIPKAKKPKGSRSRPTRGRKKTARRKNSKKAQGD